MVTRADLQSLYATKTNDDLLDVLASDDYSEEAKSVARELLDGRGIGDAPFRHAGSVDATRRPARPKQPVPGEPSAWINVWIVTRGMMLVGVGLIASCFAISVGSVAIGGFAIGTAAGGLHLIVRHRSTRWIGTIALVVGWGSIIPSARVEEDWFNVARLFVPMVLGIALLQGVRTKAEIRREDHK